MLINSIKALILLTILLFSVPAWAVPAYVQGHYDEDTGSTCNVTLQSSTTAGNFLVAMMRIGGNVSVSCVNDGESFTQDAEIRPDLDDWDFFVLHLADISGNSDTVTCTVTGSHDLCRISVMEFSDVTGPAIDTSTNEGGGSNVKAGTVTTNVDDVLLFAGVASDSAELKSEPNPGSGYAICGDFGLGGTAIPDKSDCEYRAVTSQGTYSGNFSGVSMGTWAAILVAYSAEAAPENPELPSNQPPSSDIYWVSTTGTETTWANCESATDPGSGYCSLATANSNAEPGDTINLIAGTYNSNGETISPANSGVNGARIIYQAYGGAVTISGAACNTGSEPAVELDGDDYIVVDGIDSSGCNHHLWITNGADHNEIKNGSFDNNNNADWNHSVINNDSTYNWVHDCQLSKGGSAADGGDDNGALLDIGNEYDSGDNSSYNLIEDCVFFHGGHHILGLQAPYNTIRNNYFHNEAWTSGHGNRSLYAGAYSDALGSYNLIEGNRWGYTAKSVDDGYTGNFVLTIPNTIVRYNMIYHNEGYGMGVAGYSGGSNAEDNRIYNNTFFNNGLGLEGGSSDAAVYVTADAGQSPTGNVFKNNLYDSHYQNYGGNRYSQQTYANEFTSGDPLFTNASTSPPANKTDDTVPDLTLSSSSSPAVDAGGALTKVSSADTGAGTLLIVSDASYFQDGTYAPPGKVDADWIVVGTIGNVSQIVSISGNSITLMKAITRNDNDPVWLYKKSDGARVFYGSAPDAGAHEFNETQAGGLSPPRNLRIVE